MVAQDAMAFVERAKQHLQMFGGGSPYQDANLLQMYQRPNLGNINLGLWQGFWPQQIPSGFLSTIAAAPKNLTQPHQNATQTSSTSAELRDKYFKRFSPYQIPQHPPAPGSPPN